MSGEGWKSTIICLLAGSLLLPTHARFVIEKGGLRIKFPTSAASEYPNGFDMSLGNFGSPLYGGALTGKLIYVDADHGYNTQCTPECRYACSAFNVSSPPLKLDQSEQYIMLIDRGPTNSFTPACKFTEKVWNAQNAGAVAVLVINYEDSHTTMDAPDEEDEDKNFRYLTQLTIPAAFIPKSTGDILKGLVRRGQTEEAHVIMDWTDVLPRASKVHWQFWSGSNDMCGAKCNVQKDFIKQFVPAARELEQGNWTAFQPHYLTHLCPEVYLGTHECETQCIHKGRYCAPDPDGSIEEGYSGSEVVQENLRQLCVFKLGNESGKPWVWWDYVTRFAESCTMSAKQYTKECAESVFHEVGGSQWASLEKFRDCAGGIDEDRENALLEEELRSQRGSGDVGEVYILPTIRINDGQYRGRLAYLDVLRAICSGFKKGQEPSACMHVTTDACYVGSPAQVACKSNTDGKVKCLNTFSGYECGCGNCYNEVIGKNGERSCQPKCNLKSCNEETGVCSTSSGMTFWGILIVVGVALALMTAAAVGFYKWRLRQEMQDEVKSILKQYMPLAESEEKAELRPENAAENA